jgi:hypothetical protein
MNMGLNCKIELIEYFPCDTLLELQRQEGKHIKNTECVNKYVAGRTNKEYYEDNKDKKKEYKKEWYEQNKDKINDHHKNYYQNNKDKIKELQKKYNEQNRDKINEQRRERYKLKKQSVKIENTE